MRTHFADTSGQATVEAALILPVILLALALLVQPLCVTYTKTVMNGAAAEAARLMASGGTVPQEQVVQDFIKRRLDAVPDVSIFCKADGQDWTVEATQADGTARVHIATKAKPLPLMGFIAAPFARADGLIDIDAVVEVGMRPEWLEGTYAGWQEAWG